MSNRPRLPPEQIITNGDMSAASITSLVTLLPSLSLGTYSYSWSGTSPVGNIAIQISDDYSIYPNGTVNNPGTWNTVYVTLNGSLIVNAIPVSGNTGNGIVEWSTGAYAIRTVYTKTSGTGTLQAFVTAKVA
jgi:hypothetical protein